jgi:hypothetical protein
MCALVPDPLVIVGHLNWLVASALKFDSALRFEIAWGPPDAGPKHARTFRLDEIAAASNCAVRANTTGCNVYVGATLKGSDTPSKGRTGGSQAVLAVCLPIDIDGNFQAGLQKLDRYAKPQLIVTTGATPEPRGQVWIGIAPTCDLELWEEVNRRSVYSCGGDKNALGSYRLMRLAGTVSYPSSEKQQRGYVTDLTSAHYYEAPSYKLEDLLTAFPPVESHTPRPSKRLSYGNLSTKTIPVNLVNVAIIQSMLDFLPDKYAVEHDLWVRIGFALYHFDPHEFGFALWVKFSKRCPEKAAITDFEKKWANFDRSYKGVKITLWTLRYVACQHGWQQKSPWFYSSLNVK